MNCQFTEEVSVTNKYIMTSNLLTLKKLLIKTIDFHPRLSKINTPEHC